MASLPRPPIKSMTDFVVFAFVTIVACILLVGVLGTFLGGLFRPKEDRSATIGALADICTTLIGALVGFVAGKGQGQAEAREAEIERQEQRQTPPPHDKEPEP